MGKLAVAGGAALVVVAVVSGCSAGSTGTEDGPITFGAFVPITGAVANPSNQDAVKLAEEAINADGGILGRDVDIEIYDVGDTPESAVNAVNRGISDGIQFAFGFANSPQVLATAGAFQDAEVPLLFFTVSQVLDFETTGNPWLYRGLPAAAPISDRGIQYLHDELGVEDFATVTTSDDGSKASHPFIDAAVEDLGGKVVTSIEYSPQATDTTSEVLDITGSGAEGMFLWGFPQPQAVLIRQLRQAGSDIPIMLDYGGSFQISNNLLPAELLSGVYSSAACPVDLLDSAADVYAELPQPDKADTYTGLFYDSVFVFADVIEAAGSVDPTSVQEGLASPDSLDYDGICGSYVGSDDHNVANFGVVLSLEGGELTVAPGQ